MVPGLLQTPEYARYRLAEGSRRNDWPAFWGGNVIQSSYEFCSGGFGVHNSSSGTYLITAAHCADNGSGYVNGIAFHNGQDPGNWKFIGYITDVPGPHDLAVIPTNAGNQYYDGPGLKNGDTTNTKIVAGQQATSLGDSLCESGAIGGVRCGFTVAVLEVSQIDAHHPSQMWSGLVGTTGNYAEDGDSGGPWFSLDGCCTHVWAKGIEHGSFLFGNTFYEGFTPITTATSDMGVWVNKG
jgi:streptogrisin D